MTRPVLLLLALLASLTIEAAPMEPAMDIRDREPGMPIDPLAEQVRMYEAAAQSINEALARAIGRMAGAEGREVVTAGWQAARAAQMRAEIAPILQRLGSPSARLDAATERAVRRSIGSAEAQMRELGLRPFERVDRLTGVGFGAVDQRAVEAIARDTAAKATSDIAGSMARALDHQGRAAGDLFRRLSSATTADGRSPLTESAANRAIAQGIITGDVREAMGLMRQIFADPALTESYRKVGNKIIQVGQAEMTVRSYAALVVRTRTREATVAARHERLGASGIDLVQITGRASENFCTAFVGLVCSLSAEQVIDGLRIPALASLPEGGPPFHPNCTKGTAAYIPRLVSPERSTWSRRAAIEYETRARQGRLRAPVRA